MVDEGCRKRTDTKDSNIRERLVHLLRPERMGEGTEGICTGVRAPRDKGETAYAIYGANELTLRR